MWLTKAGCDMERPTVREKKSFGLADCPEVPTFEAGYLVGGNGGWRNRRPVVDVDACTGCLQCYLYCPDGAIVKEHPGQEELAVDIEKAAAGEASARRPAKLRTKVAVDYEFCKGCGICVKMCRFDALHMEAEPHE